MTNFLELVEQGFYDNLTFSRVVEGLLIQAGDTKGDLSGLRPDGKRLIAEINQHKHVAGSLSMACVDKDPNSGSAQFFICLGDADFLNGQYSAFGKIADDASLETLKKIGALATRDPGSGEKSQPVETVSIDKMTVTES